MKKLSQLQYEVIFLYSKGLTFKEIDTVLTTASRGVYSQVVAKDKSRVTRAKISRKTNLKNYKEELKKYLDIVKENNKHFKNSTQWIKEKYTIKIEMAKDRFRKKYIIDSLDKSYKSYSKYKLTFLKNHLEKVA
ncbi:MAG: hypothetical protein PHG81_03010 [Aliarcobacter sp.]|nr:hypothetical protein [Aliarcobacter sp.]